MTEEMQQKQEGRLFTWAIKVMGRQYVTVGVPGGEWCLDAPSAEGDVYILHPADSRRGVEISGQHGLYYAIDVATGFVEGMVHRGRHGV